MPLPMSRSAIEKLGKRLAADEAPSSDDLALLQEVILCHLNPLAVATSRVESLLGVRPTNRLKTTGTILDKVRRHGGAILKSMQDIGGLRLVEDITLDRQDEMVQEIVDAFRVDEFVPRVVDRRALPIGGYRAVHVVVKVDGVPVEVQVRTKHQHDWADLYEKLADNFGRSIRYGEPLERQQRYMSSTVLKTTDVAYHTMIEKIMADMEEAHYFARSAIVNSAQAASNAIASYEAANNQFDDLTRMFADVSGSGAISKLEIEQYEEKLSQNRETIVGVGATVRAAIEQLRQMMKEGIRLRFDSPVG